MLDGWGVGQRRWGWGERYGKKAFWERTSVKWRAEDVGWDIEETTWELELGFGRDEGRVGVTFSYQFFFQPPPPSFQPFYPDSTRGRIAFLFDRECPSVLLSTAVDASSLHSSQDHPSFSPRPDRFRSRPSLCSLPNPILSPSARPLSHRRSVLQRVGQGVCSCRRRHQHSHQRAGQVRLDLKAVLHPSSEDHPRCRRGVLEGGQCVREGGRGVGDPTPSR